MKEDLLVKSIEKIKKKYSGLEVGWVESKDPTKFTLNLQRNEEKLKIKVNAQPKYIQIFATTDGWTEAVDAPSDETVYLRHLLRVVGGWLTFLAAREAEKKTA